MIKKYVTKFLVSRIGSIATPIIATAVAALVARVAAFDPALSGSIDEAAIVGFIVTALVSAANYFTNTQQIDTASNRSKGSSTCRRTGGLDRGHIRKSGGPFP
jgi:hypothetical protein